MDKDQLIEKVAAILGKSVNEIAYHIPMHKQIAALVEVIENGPNKKG